MGRVKKLAFNTALLTGSSLILRTIGLAFQVWLVGRIGSSGIGLFQLVMSVGMLASTFAVSGIRFATTRLVSEETGLGRGEAGVHRAVRRCLAYSIFFGLASAAVLYAFAEPIGFLWIGDARTVLGLRLYALSLPFIALTSVIAGYFTATGKVYKNAANQISEQLVRITLTAVFLKLTPGGDIERSCAAVIAAGTIAEVFSFILAVTLYVYDRRRSGKSGETPPRVTSRMLGIALPLAFSAYARTSLSTLEHLLVPRGLKASGLTADAALSGYGVIQGMVFPIIFFPTCILMALAELLVPDLTEAQVLGQTGYISRLTDSLLDKCLMFAIGIAGIMAVFAESLGMAVYGSPEAGQYIRVFALLIPVMYLDMVTDGMLKGLGQQLYCMGVNIIDAALSVALVWWLLPRYALDGYIVIIFFTECFNFALSSRRLYKLTRLGIRVRSLVLSALCVIGASQAVSLLISVTGFDTAASVPAVLLAVFTCALVYAVLLWACGCLNKSSPRPFP